MGNRVRVSSGFTAAQCGSNLGLSAVYCGATAAEVRPQPLVRASEVPWQADRIGAGRAVVLSGHGFAELRKYDSKF